MPKYIIVVERLDAFAMAQVGSPSFHTMHVVATDSQKQDSIISSKQKMQNILSCCDN